MPAPDIQYFLDSSLQCFHIGPDTHWYLMYFCDDTNAFIDSYDSQDRRYVKRKHWDTLNDMGSYCEERLIRWRTQDPDMRQAGSYAVYESVSHQLEEFVAHYAAVAVDRGHTQFDDRAILACDEQFGLHGNLAMLKRACVRAWSDLEGYAEPVLHRGLRLMNDAWDQRRSREVVQLEELRQTLGVMETVCERDQKKAIEYLRRKLKEDRKAVKRSINHSKLILGEETTRMFIGGDKVRVEGKHCVYEMSKSGKMLSSHGGTTLSIFTKEDDIHLCNLCIYTPNVPVLDHVASLIMHIKAGEEEDILKIGNAFKLNTEVAYQQEWLVPYLPARHDGYGTEGEGDLGNAIRRHLRNTHGIEPLERPVRQARIADLRAPVARMLFDHLGKYCPPLPLTRVALLSGRDFRTDPTLIQDIEAGLELIRHNPGLQLFDPIPADVAVPRDAVEYEFED